VPHDWDVATSALPEETLSVFADWRTIPTGLKHGTVTVLSEGNPIEITTFRIDGEYKDSRRPDEVFFTEDIVSDLSRRDFTVNAMAFGERRGLVDPFGGKKDIEKKIIRAVGEPHKRFSEDALRIMRAFRFSAVLGYEIEKETLLAAIELKDKLSEIARERIAIEFLKLICAKSCSKTLKAMSDGGVLKFVLGEYSPSDALFEAMERSPSVERIRLGLLLSEATEQEKKIALSGLKLSTKLSSGALLISRRASDYLSGDAAKARRFIGSVGDLANDVLAAADALGNLDADFASAVLENIEKRACYSISDLAVNGHDLIKLGVSGKAVGDVLSKLLDEVICDPAVNNREKLLDLAEKITKAE
jgi:tRNA nucleotidyltransferase (CCA-adding enzyme)